MKIILGFSPALVLTNDGMESVAINIKMLYVILMMGRHSRKDADGIFQSENKCLEMDQQIIWRS